MSHVVACVCVCVCVSLTLDKYTCHCVSWSFVRPRNERLLTIVSIQTRAPEHSHSHNTCVCTHLINLCADARDKADSVETRQSSSQSRLLSWNCVCSRGCNVCLYLCVSAFEIGLLAIMLVTLNGAGCLQTVCCVKVSHLAFLILVGGNAWMFSGFLEGFVCVCV